MKSQVDFYVNLHAQLIRSDPLGASSSVKSFMRDILTVRLRVDHEGLAFLTKTLPKLGKALDQGLVSGRLQCPKEFATLRGTSIPVLFVAYFSRVFDEDGILLEEPNVDAVKHLRQILFVAYKLELPYSKSDEQVVIDKFIQTDAELVLDDESPANDFLSLARLITRKVFHGFDHKDIHPRHGPGAVATGEILEQKWEFSRLYNRIHQVYPYYDYFVVGGSRELTDRLDWYRLLQRHEDGVAKVVLVPKDSRGPRLISCEPLEFQWIQQGLGRKLAQFLEWENPYTKNRVNFTCQEINRSLAKISSTDRSYATLDLQDASDRVSLAVVRSIFKDTPLLLRALEACRSTATKLPDGSVVPLNKYAPMGSALCFPVESYIFWVTIVAAVINETNLPLVKVGSRVYIYGDDIVVPTEWATVSIQALESVGLKVNRDKSCITGNFRESCGFDSFYGVEVTPIRLKTLWSNRSSDGSALVSYVSLANSFASKGYKMASEYLWTMLETTYGKIPYGTFRASYPCRLVDDPLLATSLNLKLFRGKFNRHYQCVQFLLPSLSSRRIRSKLDGWLRLTRNLVTPPYGDPSVVVLPRSTKIKRRWTTVA